MKSTVLGLAALIAASLPQAGLGNDLPAIEQFSGTTVEFAGTGTYNGADASFRVCVQDNGEGARAEADRFFLTCTAGCTYSTGGALSGGNIQVRQH